jgi:hypothetical protein
MLLLKLWSIITIKRVRKGRLGSSNIENTSDESVI